jgi:tetratricopeptide (TPR) repeat protein
MRLRYVLVLIAGPLFLAGRAESVPSAHPDPSEIQPVRPVITPAPAADDDWKVLQQELGRLAADGKLAEQVDLLRGFIKRTKNPDLRLVAMGELAETLRDRRLNRLDEAETLARQILEAQPSEPYSYVMLSHILYEQDRLADAAAMLRAERKHVPEVTALYWSELAENLIEQVRRAPQLGPDAAGPLLSEAADASLQALRLLERNPAQSDVDMSIALGDRALILDLQAALVEQTDSGRAALTAESQRLAKASAAALAKPAPAASSAAKAQRAEAVDDEWRTIYLQSSQLFRDGKFDEGAGTLRTFIRSHPDFNRARVSLGIFHMQHVHDDTHMTRDAARACLIDAVAALDEALQRNADDIEALTYKALVLRLQAERVEVDAASASNLLADADRLIDRAKELNRQNAR